MAEKQFFDKKFDMAKDCMVCGKTIGHRGFCSQECHDKHYDSYVEKG